jgi:hypothetical protein
VWDLLLDLVVDVPLLFVRDEPDDFDLLLDLFLDLLSELLLEGCFSSLSRRISLAFSSVCLRSVERFFPPRFS